jgi:prolyl-tRNA synthetase
MRYNWRMLQSKLFTKTWKQAPKDEESRNAQLLIQGGYINKLMAGVYTFLPLGLRVLAKIENIVRDEMIAIGGQEVLMPALHPKEVWDRTGRWDSFDVLFKLKNSGGNELALGPSHEEVLYNLLTHYVGSHKDVPFSVFQIQTKFRDELRAKSGLFRGREFRMKDMYSFHATIEDRNVYYEKVKEAYFRIFNRFELEAFLTDASGGSFSKFSHEFQVLAEAGEDTIYICRSCDRAINDELVTKDKQNCNGCKGTTEKKRAIEVANIFPVKEKYAEDFSLQFKDEKGEQKIVSVGCYGIGTSRVMGAIAEIYNDEKGLKWPESVAPFAVHLLSLGDSDAVTKEASVLYDMLHSAGVEVLFDDRCSLSPGEKFADADLIGIPMRVVISEKTLSQKSIELKKRNSEEKKLVSISELLAIMKHEA